jgi:hypothetical protein
VPRGSRVACKETRNFNERLCNRHERIIGVSCANASTGCNGNERNAERKYPIIRSQAHNCVRYCYLLRPWNLPPGAFIYRRCKEGRYFYRPYNRRATRSAGRERRLCRKHEVLSNYKCYYSRFSFSSDLKNQTKKLFSERAEIDPLINRANRRVPRKPRIPRHRSAHFSRISPVMRDRNSPSDVCPLRRSGCSDRGWKGNLPNFVPAGSLAEDRNDRRPN